jgi:hypothetical protein
MSYDAWKATDPADMDPYRDTDCPACGSPEGYRCAPECDCPNCERAADERDRFEDDGREYADPRDYREGRE